MRVWDISPDKLCRLHLLGEHREIHAIWSIITNGKKGYSHHPEVIRWKNKLTALYNRHQKVVNEIERRGYHHKSPLDDKRAIGKSKQDIYLDTIEIQKKILNNKNCKCKFY